MCHEHEDETQSRTLSAGYLEFAAKCIPESAGSMQRRDMRLAYFEGQCALFNAVVDILTNDDEPIEDRELRLQKFGIELALIHRMESVERVLHAGIFIVR